MNGIPICHVNKECYSTGYLEVKLNNIRRLVNGYKKGKLGICAVKKNLKEHMCIADNKSKRLTKELWINKRQILEVAPRHESRVLKDEELVFIHNDDVGLC